MGDDRKMTLKTICDEDFVEDVAWFHENIKGIDKVSKSRREKRYEKDLAIHEAVHCVVAHVVGLDVDEMEIRDRKGFTTIGDELSKKRWRKIPLKGY